MDTPQPEEDDAFIALDPLDVVERGADGRKPELRSHRRPGRPGLHHLAGDWKDYELWFAWRPEADCLQLCLSIDRRAEKARHADACDLTNLVNQRVWVGHFEVWSDDGEVVFRHAMALPEGERPTLAQAASMIDAAMEAADRFYPAFDFLLAGGQVAGRRRSAACMFETVGQA